MLSATSAVPPGFTRDFAGVASICSVAAPVLLPAARKINTSSPDNEVTAGFPLAVIVFVPATPESTLNKPVPAFPASRSWYD